MEVCHCAKKGNPKQHTAFCSNWTLFIQTKCLKGRQGKDTTWQSLPLKDYLELYPCTSWRSRGDAWRPKTGKNHIYLKNRKCQKVNPKNYRWICLNLMVIKHGFSKCELGLTHLIVCCDQDLCFWTKAEHCMSFILTSLRLSAQSYTIFLYPSSNVMVDEWATIHLKTYSWGS